MTIPLEPPPLSMVLAQIRFAPVVAVVRDDFFASFQQAVMDEYPLTNKVEEMVLMPGADAAPRTTELWRMGDHSDQWRLTLAPSFVALETSAYPGKNPFFVRLRRALDAVAEHIRPPRVERLGVRYVCRMDDASDLARLSDLIRPEVLGVAAFVEDGRAPELSITQSSFALDGVHLSARWGVLPPNAVTDPTLRPIGQRSWLLDIDVFDERKRSFDPKRLSADALAHSRLQYRFFRWAVEPAFLLRFGADPELVATLDNP